MLLNGFANQLDKIEDLCGGKFQKLSDWHSAERHARKSLIGGHGGLKLTQLALMMMMFDHV